MRYIKAYLPLWGEAVQRVVHSETVVEQLMRKQWNYFRPNYSEYMEIEYSLPA